MARNLERRPTHPGRLLRGEIEARELNQGQVGGSCRCQGSAQIRVEIQHKGGPSLVVSPERSCGSG